MTQDDDKTKGLLFSPEVLGGIGLLTAGLSGKSPNAAFPSMLQGLQTANLYQKYLKDQKQTEALGEFTKDLPTDQKLLATAFPKQYAASKFKTTKSDIKTFKKGNNVVSLDLSVPADKAKSRQLLADGYTAFTQSVQGADLGSLDKSGKSKSQKSIIDNTKLLGQLRTEQVLFEPEYLTAQGKLKYEFLKKKDFANPNSLNTDERIFLKGYDKWLQTNLQYFNQYRKLITGVAAGEKEIGWLQSSIPSTKDSPTSYQAKIKNQIKITERLIKNEKTFLSEKGVNAVNDKGEYSKEYIKYLKDKKFQPTVDEIKTTIAGYKGDFGNNKDKIFSLLDIEYAGVDWRQIAGIK